MILTCFRLIYNLHVKFEVNPGLAFNVIKYIKYIYININVYV